MWHARGWEEGARGLSGGRVQSVAWRLVVEREREIRAFIPEEYWDINALLNTHKKDSIKCEVKKFNKDAFKPVTSVEAMSAVVCPKRLSL